LKGVGAGFPMTLGYGVPCVRAGHHCHAEALSEAGINTSPRLFGMDVKHLCVTVCVVYTFSDLGIVVLGHLKCQKPDTPGACLGEKRPENGRSATGLASNTATGLGLEQDPRTAVSSA
jgi:hypothetical protein